MTSTLVNHSATGQFSSLDVEIEPKHRQAYQLMVECLTTSIASGPCEDDDMEENWKDAGAIGVSLTSHERLKACANAVYSVQVLQNWDWDLWPQGPQWMVVEGNYVLGSCFLNN